MTGPAGDRAIWAHCSVVLVRDIDTDLLPFLSVLHQKEGQKPKTNLPESHTQSRTSRFAAPALGLQVPTLLPTTPSSPDGAFARLSECARQMVVKYT